MPELCDVRSGQSVSVTSQKPCLCPLLSPHNKTDVGKGEVSLPVLGRNKQLSPAEPLLLPSMNMGVLRTSELDATLCIPSTGNYKIVDITIASIYGLVRIL